MAADARIGRVGQMVKRLQVRHHRAADGELRSLNLSLVQWDVLRHLQENPDASLHDLAQLTFQSDQAMGTLAGRMEGRGLIERIPGPGRPVRHRLTPEGERRRAEGAEIVTRLFSGSLSPLTAEELTTLDRLLTKVLGPDAPVSAAGR